MRTRPYYEKPFLPCGRFFILPHHSIMKSLLYSLLLLCETSNAFTQVPQGIPYQSAMRNSSGGILANQNVSIRFSLHDSVINGTNVYQETHNATIW